MPNISVIMSVYNDNKYLNSSIKSILDQTFNDFEFIITDDYSTDNSLEILKKYQQKDSRIILICNSENRGLTKNLNAMIKLAKGKYIARMDSDDISKNYRLNDQIKIFNNNPNIDFVFGDTMFIDFEGNEICRSWRPRKLSKILSLMDKVSYIPHPTVMIKKEVFDKFGCYNESCITGQDKELWERLIKENVNFFYLKTILLHYRINPQGVSFKKMEKLDKYYYKLVNLCIDNFQRKRALKLLKLNRNKVTFKDKIILLIKFIMPVMLRHFKGKNLRIKRNKLINGNYN